MADDIVKRLRDAEWESVLYELAADEIERLRAKCKELDDGWTNCVLSLRAAHDAMGEWKPAMLAAEAERDRLRAALERIANFDTVDVSLWNAKAMRDIARAALAGDAKHEVVRLGDGATYCPGCTVTFPVEIGPVVAGSGENIAGTFTVGPVVPASDALSGKARLAQECFACGKTPCGCVSESVDAPDGPPASGAQSIPPERLAALKKLSGSLNAPPESNDRAHVWTWIRQRKWHMCDVCGVIRRADDRNPPCSGPVKVTTRDAAQPPAAPHASDCAVHNQPYKPAGPCDCGASK